MIKLKDLLNEEKLIPDSVLSSWTLNVVKKMVKNTKGPKPEMKRPPKASVGRDSGGADTTFITWNRSDFEVTVDISFWVFPSMPVKDDTVDLKIIIKTPDRGVLRFERKYKMSVDDKEVITDGSNYINDILQRT